MMTVRSSLGTGFRAPSLSELFTPETLGTSLLLDGLVHSIAWAPAEDLQGSFVETSRAGFAQANRNKLGMTLDQALEQNAAEVWEMLQGADTRVFIAGPQAMQAGVDKALAAMAGGPDAWAALRQRIAAGGRWQEVLY